MKKVWVITGKRFKVDCSVKKNPVTFSEVSMPLEQCCYNVSMTAFKDNLRSALCAYYHHIGEYVNRADIKIHSWEEVGTVSDYLPDNN